MFVQLKICLRFVFADNFVSSESRKSFSIGVKRKKIYKRCKTILKSSGGSLKLKTLSTCRWKHCAYIITNEGVWNRLFIRITLCDLISNGE